MDYSLTIQESKDCLVTNLVEFIEREKTYLQSLGSGIDWDSTDWKTSNWLFHRGAMHSLPFRELVPGKRQTAPLPPQYSDFCKAIAVYIERTKNAGFISIHKYVIECRRLFTVMKDRGETSAAQLTRWHFERCVEMLIESNYKNLYDAANNLQVISSIVDLKGITPSLIEFKHSIKVTTSRNDYIPISELGSDETRKDNEKLPSYEALKAYSICTNNPIDDEEEILLRTIDLLIAMGQRGNEIAFIPYDCWVEQNKLSRQGTPEKDMHGKEITKVGIRYYAEKKFQSRVHWLADQDIAFAKRAVDRLKLITAKVREVAKFQEENPDKIWNKKPDEIIDDTFISSFMDEITFEQLNERLSYNGVKPIKREKVKEGRKRRQGNSYNWIYYYRAGDIENLIKSKLKLKLNHVQLKERKGNSWKIILKTSEVLSIRFHGAFNNRAVDMFNRLKPNRVTLQEINMGLGSIHGVKSIFEIRGLTEADGSKISLTSHQARHWRNTLYELAGMSNVQQALALGRQKLDQNATYQHTSILERTKSHKDFLSFQSPSEKVQFLHNGIREKKILGEVTNLYHRLKEEKGKQIAETFLATHAGAIHLTPFGGCTHDFSQAPCPKHIQCWNGCSHLHRTNTPGESERIQEQIDLGLLALEEMKKDSDGEYGADVWINDLKTKIANMQKALDIKPVEKPVKVFPQGTQMTIPLSDRKRSSVSED